MPSANRRYSFGVLGVAFVGVAMFVVYAWWSGHAITSASETNLEDRARFAASQYRKILTRELNKLDPFGRMLNPLDPKAQENWAILESTLENTFELLPNLRGIVIHLPNGSLATIIGPSGLQLQRIPFLAPPEKRGDMAVRRENVDPPQVVVSFHVSGRPEAPQAALANLHLTFLSTSGFEHEVVQKFRIGALLVVVVIYLLAVLAFFIGRQGARAEGLEREKAVRLKAIGEVAGAIAHELRNPLNAISLSFQVIGETLRAVGVLEGSRAGDLERARGEVEKISKVVDNFVSFARLSDLNMAELDLAEVAREAFDEIAPAASAASVKAEFHVTGTTRLRGDRNKLREVLATTLSAVFDAVKARPGTLDLDLAGTRREIAVTIRGRGDRVDSRRVSNFASARRAWDEPVGLSLTIARTWIDCHGGTVRGGEPSGSHAELVIVLPKGFV